MFLDEEKKGVEGKFYELSKEVIVSVNLSLYDLEFVKSCNTLRLYILNESTNTATLDECASVDRALGPLIESNSWIPESLVLEVSSPGIFRKLKSHDHFLRAKGSMVELLLDKDLNLSSSEIGKKIKNKKKIRAKIMEVNKQEIEIELDGEKVAIDFNDIKKASLSPDINF